MNGIVNHTAQRFGDKDDDVSNAWLRTTERSVLPKAVSARLTHRHLSSLAFVLASLEADFYHERFECVSNNKVHFRCRGRKLFCPKQIASAR